MRNVAPLRGCSGSQEWSSEEDTVEATAAELKLLRCSAPPFRRFVFLRNTTFRVDLSSSELRMLHYTNFMLQLASNYTCSSSASNDEVTKILVIDVPLGQGKRMPITWLYPSRVCAL